MRSCPTCQRTYTDDNQTHCAYDGAQLSAPYYPQPGQYQQPSQYGPPPGANPMMPPPGYPPPVYPPPPGGWQGYAPPAYSLGSSEYVACPRCRRPDPEKLSFTWWGGMVGPRMFHHVRCRLCGLTYNGKTGGSNTTNIVVYSIIGSIIAFVFFFFVFRALWRF